MKAMTQTQDRSRAASLVAYGLALSLVLLAPLLGAVVAAVAVWQALLAGSIWYAALGLVLVLSVIAMVQSHRLFDLAVLGLAVAVMVTWFATDSAHQSRLLEVSQALTVETRLMAGVATVLTLILIHAVRRWGRW